jgi:hypothetical protein
MKTYRKGRSIAPLSLKLGTAGYAAALICVENQLAFVDLVYCTLNSR